MNSKISYTILADLLYIPSKAAFNALTCLLGPTINVVPVSAMAYVDVLIIVDPTCTLFKINQ